MKEFLKNIAKAILIIPIATCFIIGAAFMYCAFPFAWVYNKLCPKAEEPAE